MIKPTVGRIVHVRHQNDEQPLAGIVTYVYNDTLISVCGFTREGMPYAVTGLHLKQDGDESLHEMWAEWMPYQKGQAAKTEQLEKQLGGAT